MECLGESEAFVGTCPSGFTYSRCASCAGGHTVLRKLVLCYFLAIQGHLAPLVCHRYSCTATVFEAAEWKWVIDIKLCTTSRLSAKQFAGGSFLTGFLDMSKVSCRKSVNDKHV